MERPGIPLPPVPRFRLYLCIRWMVLTAIVLGLEPSVFLTHDNSDETRLEQLVMRPTPRAGKVDDGTGCL